MKFLIIDGNSLANRAFYGIKSLYNHSGQPTNAIYGFLNILIKLINEINPKYIAIAFDVKAPNFRKKQYNEYKSNRKPTPNDLITQLDIIKKILNLMGLCIVEKPGFEADDILGTLSNLTQSIKDLKCIIATGDKDSLQLINNNVIVKIMSSKFSSPITINYDQETIINKYGVLPNELIDVKALMGDPSDNIPGVSGIGEKTALTLISKYHNIETIYNNIETLNEKTSLKNKLILSKEMAFLSKELVTICNCVPINLDINHYAIAPKNNSELLKILSDLEMFSIIKRLDLNNIDRSLNTPTNLNLSKQITFDNLEKINNLEIPNSTNEISRILEKSISKKIYFLSQDNQNYILMVDDKIFSGSINNLDIYKILIDHYNKHNDIEIYTHQAKNFHLKMLSSYNQTIPVKFDSQIAGYLLNSDTGNYELDNLINLYCLTTLYQSDKDKILLFANLCQVMIDEINLNNLSFLLYEVELPFSIVLANMELSGFKLDQNGLISFGENLDDDIEHLKNEIYLMANCEFNINSPKQLSQILFENLMLPTSKKNKTGYSTNAEVLEYLQDKHPIINKILKYRLLIKLKNTYVDGLIKEVKLDNRIHSIFNQTETRTGRISSQKPNMQNIPIKTTLGSKLRSYFIAEDGHKLIDGDYSQIELRILADISNDQNMIEAFNNNQDIHIKTAAEIFNVTIDKVTSKMRSFAKSVNFSIIYGISSFSLAKDIGTSISEAQQYIDLYFKKFPNVKKYLDNAVYNATKNGYVTTPFGRKRYIPELSSKNKNTKSLGERIAKNTPIQGAAADIIKIAMVNVYNRLKSEKLKSKIILQVHDELIIESPIDELTIAKTILQNEMQSATQLKLPLKVDIGIGDRWIDCHQL